MPGIEVHLRLTKTWALEEGMSEADAEAVARADIGVDELWPGSRKPVRHFNPTASLMIAPLELRRSIALARAGQRAQALTHLGYSLHSRQDAIGHGRLGLSHLRWTAGMLRRHPDVWEEMPPGVRSRIERATRRAIRLFLAATTPALQRAADSR